MAAGKFLRGSFTIPQTVREYLACCFDFTKWRQSSATSATEDGGIEGDSGVDQALSNSSSATTHYGSVSKNSKDNRHNRRKKKTSVTSHDATSLGGGGTDSGIMTSSQERLDVTGVSSRGVEGVRGAMVEQRDDYKGINEWHEHLGRGSRLV